MVIDRGQPAVRPLAAGFGFGEGPRWFEGLLWFSDLLGQAVHTVDLNGSLGTLALPGHAPSGLGFGPDGTLFIASVRERQILRYNGEAVTVYADLSALVPADLGDMVIDDAGRVYVGSQARRDGVIVCVEPDGRARVVAAGLDFPNGMAITDDRRTLLVAESTARRISALRIDDDGALGARRTFADGLDGPPDGIALDEAGGLWVAMTLANQFARIVEGATVTDRIGVGDEVAIACTLGGPQRRTLFLVTTADAYPERMAGTRSSRVHTTTVDIPGAGLP